MIVSYFSLSDQGVKLDKIGSSFFCNETLSAAHSSESVRAKENVAFMAKDLMDRVAEGKLDAMVNKVLSRDELPDGLNEVKDNHVKGKIIVRMQSE